MPRPHCEALVGPDRSRSEQTAKTSYPSLNSTSAPSRRWLLDPGARLGTRDAQSRSSRSRYICHPGKTLMYSTVDTSIIILISSPSSLPDLT